MGIRRRTIMYEAIKFRNDSSERGVIISGESERLINARKASCAMLYQGIRNRKTLTMEIHTTWPRHSSFIS